MFKYGKLHAHAYSYMYVSEVTMSNEQKDKSCLDNRIGLLMHMALHACV